MKKESREVPTNLLPVNCFLRDTVTAKDLHTEYLQRTYMELQRKTVQNGIVEELKEVPYEITPASVKSFANSSDYHADPAGAILRFTIKSQLRSKLLPVPIFCGNSFRIEPISA